MVIKLYRYQLPTTTQEWKIREGLILQTEKSFGEIAPLPRFSQETLEEALVEVLDWIHFQKQPKLPSVRWGIECAQRPLHPVHLPLRALGPKEGFSTIKLKIGHLSVADALILVKKWHGKARVHLDSNGNWTLDQALEFARHFKATDFEDWEDPVQTRQQLIEFSEKTNFPIAIDHGDHTDLSAIPSLKTIVVKPMLHGSIPEIPSHLNLILSSSYETGLGLLHIANRAKNFLPLGLDTYCALQNDILITPIQCSAGYFSWKPSESIIQKAKLKRIILNN